VPSQFIPDDKSLNSSGSSESPGLDAHANVDNPVALYSRAALDEEIRKFVRQHDGMYQHLRILQRGAQLARDKPDALANDNDLLTEHRTYLETAEEQDGFSKQSKFLKGSLVSTCLAGVIQ
jgi:hypothetical protein